ncbi:Adenylyltransferase and sulfurtransferase MOCS3, partial [Pseudolycoriella hygida]
KEVDKLLEDITALRRELEEKEILLQRIQLAETTYSCNELNNTEIARYSRQLILPEVGVAGQLKLKRSSVLVVGCGGLGCPAALYLVGAGVGHIGLVDYDTVELNNLHRQLLHKETAVGVMKSESAKNYLSNTVLSFDSINETILFNFALYSVRNFLCFSPVDRLNSSIKISTHNVQLSSENAMNIINEYDIILDATDNVATRYLLNDACVLGGKPLVSGSALQFEGQLTVYNHDSGPCYRCLFPTPPPPETVTNCGDGGVIGAVPGVIGTLQALEAIKIILSLEGHLSGRLLLFDGIQASFRNVKLRGKQQSCSVCSDMATITKLIDYEQFCGMKASDKDTKLNVLCEDDRITVSQYDSIVKEKINHILVDVRSSLEFDICKMPSAINIPIKDILNDITFSGIMSNLKSNEKLPIYVVCRRGNDSQIAAKRINDAGADEIKAKDIIGGLHSWAKVIDPSFPVY